jgi:signal transduction histidine kinase
MSVIENFLVPERLESREPSASRMTQSAAAAATPRTEPAIADAALLHEIRNALAAVLGHAELMPVLDDLNADATASLQQIVRGARRALDLANTRRVAQKPPVQSSTSKPSAVVEDVVEALRPVCRERVAIEVSNGPGLPRVACPSDRLHQVLSNLVKNAIEAFAGGTGMIRVSARASRCAAERGHQIPAVEFTVADDGPGISTEVRSRIFDPFFTTKAEQGGTGVGLSVVQSIVREHSGFVNCASRPGAGTVFRVVLPAMPGE